MSNCFLFALFNVKFLRGLQTCFYEKKKKLSNRDGVDFNTIILIFREPEINATGKSNCKYDQLVEYYEEVGWDLGLIDEKYLFIKVNLLFHGECPIPLVHNYLNEYAY